MVMAKPDPKPFPNLPPKPLPKPLPPLEPPHHCEPPKPGSFEAKDGNGDGKLNADEFNEGRSLIDKLKDPDKFDRYDADNDGYVTQKENFIGQIKDSIGDFKKSKVGLPDFKKAGGEIGAEAKAEAKLEAKQPE